MNLMSSMKADVARDHDESWFKDAIIYQLHVRAFADSNNDGIGDFIGLTQKRRRLRRKNAKPNSVSRRPDQCQSSRAGARPTLWKRWKKR